MPIIHNKARENFAIVSNIVLRNQGISWKAKGIYAYLCGCESGFNVTRATLATFGDCGKGAVSSGIEELERAGLLEIEQSNEGHFGSNKWTLNLPSAADLPVGGFSADGYTATNKNNNNKMIDNNKCTTYTAAAEKPRAASAWLPPGIRDGLVAIGLTKDSIDLVARNFGALKRIWTSYPKGRRRRFADLAAGFCRAVELGAAMELDIPAMEAWLKQASAEETKYLPAIDVWAEGAGWKPTKATTKALVDRPFRPHAANDTWGNQCNTYRQSGASEKEIEYIRQRSGWFARYREASGATPAEIVEKARAELASRVSVSSEMLKV